MNRALTVLAVLLAPAALAQEDWNFPNPNRSAGVAATCDSWPAQRRAADPQAMQVIVGVWEGQAMMPGTPGIMPDTPYQYRATNRPDGTFTLERYGCFTMQSVPGMPSLGESCATSMIYGEWVAHFAEGGSVAVVSLSAGSGFTGQALPMSCGIGYFWPEGRDVLVDQAGNRMRRTGY